MEKEKEVHEFAVKWFEKYRSPKTKESEVEEGFSEECISLGFEMDCVKAFEATYKDTNALKDYAALDRIINQVHDINLLGSAIFSQWRYVTHWAETGLLNHEYREWFIIAFARLVVLSSEEGSSQFVF
ncbi:MAG: hypothetical protein ACOWWH_01020 [Eubacteriaceae bacterium]